MKQLLSIALALSPAFIATAQPRTQIRVVALNGDPAPGTGGALFTSFDRPAVSPLGLVSFAARANDMAPGAFGVWNEGTSALELVVRNGDADSITGGTFGLLPINVLLGPPLTSSGRTVFVASLVGGGINDTNDSGLWRQHFGSISLLAREGSIAPGTTLAFRDLSTDICATQPVINESNQVAFMAGIGVGGTATGLWSDVSGSVALVARTGSGSSAGPSYASFGVDGGYNAQPALNSQGVLAFLARLSSGGFTSHTVNTTRTGAVGVAYRAGNIAPGTTDAFFTFGRVSQSGANDLSFPAGLSPFSAGADVDSGIWVETAGTLGLAVREDNAVPGLSGVRFGTLGLNGAAENFQVEMSELGSVLFASTLRGTAVTGSNDSALFVHRAGATFLIAREGDVGPDATLYGSLGGGQAISQLETIVFLDSNSILWGTDLLGRVGRLIGAGDTISTPTGPRVVAGISSPIFGAGGVDGRTTALSNCTVAVSVAFSDATVGVLAIQFSCPSDYNFDCAVNPDDLGEFINCYFAEPPCPRADFNDDESVNPDDLAEFLNAYFEGC